MIDATFYGGCDTCNRSWGETKCMGCLWDGKLQRNTHWEPKEPFINKPCVSEQACHEDKVKILEKIKAEIAGLTITEGGEDYTRKMAELFSLKIRVLQIIDKYMSKI